MFPPTAIAVRTALSGSLLATPSTPRKNRPRKSGTLKFPPPQPHEQPITACSSG